MEYHVVNISREASDALVLGKELLLVSGGRIRGVGYAVTGEPIPVDRPQTDAGVIAAWEKRGDG